MAVTKVKAPDGSIVEVEHEEGASRDEIISLAKRQQVVLAEQPGFLDRAAGIAGDAIMGAVGIGEAAGIMAGTAATDAAAGLYGIGAGVIPGGQSAAEGVEKIQGMTEGLLTPRTPVAQGIFNTLAPVGEAMERGADFVATNTGSESDTLGAAGVKTALLGAPALVGLRGLQARSRANQAQRNRPPAPTTEELGQISRQNYQAADNAGVVLRPQSSGQLALNLVDELEEFGIDPDLQPRATRALQRASEALMSDQPITFPELYRLRRIASQAAQTGDRSDAAASRMIRDSIDEYIDNLDYTDVAQGDPLAAAQFIRQARTAHRQFRKAEILDEAMRKAQLDAGDTVGAGYENKLRIRFRQIARNERQFAMFSPEEQRLITRVAQGGSVDNFWRGLGKLNPGGVVSGGISFGLSTSLFGPGGSFVLPIVGAGARRVATNRTIRNADRASEEVRRAGTTQQ